MRPEEVAVTLERIWLKSQDPKEAFLHWLASNPELAENPLGVERAIVVASLGPVGTATLKSWLLSWRRERSVEQALVKLEREGTADNLAAAGLAESLATERQFQRYLHIVPDPMRLARPAGAAEQWSDSEVVRRPLSARLSAFDKALDNGPAGRPFLASEVAAQHRLSASLAHRILHDRAVERAVSISYQAVQAIRDDHLCRNGHRAEWRALFDRPQRCVVCQEYFRANPRQIIVWYQSAQAESAVDDPISHWQGRSSRTLHGDDIERDTLAALLREGVVEDFEPIRILHLSDLHIAFGRVCRSVAAALRIGRATEISWDAVASFLRLRRAPRPDVVIASGDLSTLGDRRSLAVARTKLLELLDRLGVSSQALVVVPGNHDRIADVLSVLRRRSHFEQEFPEWNLAKSLTVRGRSVHLVPFDSTVRRRGSVRSVNRGRVRQAELDRLQQALRGLAREPGDLCVAVLHHHPLPIPATRLESYTAMDDGGTVLRRLQELGVDIVFHGHKHRHYSCKVDYGGGRSVVVVASGTASESRSATSLAWVEAFSSGSTKIEFYVRPDDAFRLESDSSRIFR